MHFTASEQVQLWGRGWWLRRGIGDLGDSEGGLEKENKFITLPYLHITPQRPVNEDSGEMSGPRPLPQKVIRRSPRVNMSFTILTPRPLTSSSPGSPLRFTQLGSYTPAFAQNHKFHALFPNGAKPLLCVYLCRLQGWCDGKWLQMSPL